MAIRKIIHEGDELLRKKSKPITVFDNNLKELVKDMEETLDKANGAGLAAVQVGLLKRLFIILHKNKKLTVINPEIISSSGTNKYQIEGCLSVPGKNGLVDRPHEVIAKFQDVNGNYVEKRFTGFTAKAFCHEYDHLDGILYIDKAFKMFKDDNELDNYIQELKKKREENKN